MKLLFVTLAMLAVPAMAHAQDQDQGLETVVVTGDPAHLIETADSDTALGLSKPLAETPRSVTVISDKTVARYGIEGVDDLTAIAPNAYTASYYGVEGAVNLRGTLAETYFQGFKRAENRGTYSTPLADASAIDILRGPPSPIYGAGKVGGLINFVPKTDAAGGEGGDVSATYGSYSQRNLTGSYNLPLAVAGGEGGLHVYGELDDSFSFYRGLHPRHQLAEASASLGWGAWTLSADYLFYHSTGDVQTPGWNRLTQNLIDNGTYITGRNTSLTDADGNGRLTLNELGGNPYTGAGNFAPLALTYPYCGACTDAAHTLDTGVGTTHLSPRTVYIAKGVDFSNTTTHTGFAELGTALAGGDTVKLQLFADTLGNDRFVSYGYPGAYDTLIGEARLRYDFTRTAFDGRLTIATVAGGGYRSVKAHARESYNSGVIALDRRDISQGPAANDIIDSPFNTDPPGAVGLGWETDIRSTTNDAGLFATSDIAWDRHLDLILGGRYDDYNVRSTDAGVLSYEGPAGRANAGRFTGSASLSYKTDLGLVPYVTIAKNSAVEIGQASEVPTSLLTDNGWLSDSRLTEAGVKFGGERFYASLAWYHQTRTELEQNGGPPTVQGTRGQGEELEMRYLFSPEISATLAASLQETRVDDPPNTFAYIPGRSIGISPLAAFGGSYDTYDLASLPGLAGSYADTLIPHAVVSPYLTYTAPAQDWGDWGASFGGSYVSQTVQTVPDPLVFPSYVTLNASVFARSGPWQAAININNLGGERYFTPDADTYANLAALPGVGRTWRLTLRRLF